ncbi:hypothetical protein [Actinacidiphila sp. bgisy160]|uniref:hypothetical protein n=1 Tax=Actinacidiphila sp. bgisy160 TaxID=3413796 RepID=UPI003D7479CE
MPAAFPGAVARTSCAARAAGSARRAYPLPLRANRTRDPLRLDTDHDGRACVHGDQGVSRR